MDNLILNDWLDDPMLHGPTSGSTPVTGTVNISSSAAMRPLGSPANNQTPSPRSSVSIRRTADSLELEQLVSKTPFNISEVMLHILVRYFHVPSKEILEDLRLVDIILDQTYPHSLTLRKLEEASSYYRYFNTVSRQECIKDCPIFYCSLYFYFTWGSKSGKELRWNDCLAARLFSLSTKDFPSATKDNPQKNVRQNCSMSNKVTRASIPLVDGLREQVYPWLEKLQDDMNKHDRVNYKLFSLIELFQYLGDCLIQDMAFLDCTEQLPAIYEMVRESNTQLFNSTLFKKYRNKMKQYLEDGAIPIDWSHALLEKIGEKFQEMTTYTSKENTRINKEILGLKAEIGNISSMISQILQIQQQILAGGFNVNEPNITTNATNTTNSNNTNTALSHSLLLDRNLLNTLSPGEHITPLVPINSLPLLNQKVVNDSKRKLPLPPAPNLADQTPGGTYKRFRFDDRAVDSLGGGPTGAHLESFMSRTASSPRIPIVSLTSGGTPSHPLLNVSSPRTLAAQQIKTFPDPAPSNDGSPAVAITPNFSVESNTKTSPSVITGANGGTMPEGTNHKEGVSSHQGRLNESIKYKLSRDNKTIWDLYTEWYMGLNGKPSIKSLIDKYGWRRWKVSEDSHFFPTRRIIMNYIEKECKRGVDMGKYSSTLDREEVRKLVVKDLESFRVNNGLTLNSLSLYFRNLTRETREICIYNNFSDWSLLVLPEDEKNRYCKRKQGSL